ncbi:MAG TPA: S8 family serine peptidase [Puia sp.]|nr:S8 family serine peptidase [Puia sp.]
MKDSIRVFGEITDSAACQNCDSDLLLLSGPGPQAFIQQSGSGGSGGSKPGTPGGGGGPAFYCANLSFRVPDLHLDSPYLTNYKPVNLPFNKFPNNNKNVTTVAVFDTGRDTGSITNFFVSGVSQTCLLDTRSQFGWNFVGNNSNTLDDYPTRHGSVVTRFIVNQVLQYSSNSVISPGGSVNILPVKIFDSTGKGSLYNILCGIAYAANCGAKVINASFGFYDRSDTTINEVAAVMMQNYMRHYLVKNNILMVAAAGNDNPSEDSIYWAQTGNKSANPRNLDSNFFYPACLVKDKLLKNNLLVVTTVSYTSGQVSPLQNFSNGIVDIGVNCDAIIDSGNIQYYSFVNPIQPNDLIVIGGERKFKIHTVTGSSFATPIVTGKIVAYYNTLVNNNILNKDGLLNNIQSINPYGPGLSLSLLRPVSQFNSTIRNGLTCSKTP